MKCPKCSYISFDFNQVCPKCNKDIAVEQAKLHIPSFRPEAPALLGALIGEADDSSTGVAVDTSTGIDSGELDFEDSGAVDSGELSFEDSGAMDSGDVGFEDSEELDMGFESGGEPTEGVVSAFDSAELEPSSSDVEIASEDSVTDFELGGDETALSMDSGEFPSEASTESEPEPEPVTGEGELEIDLEDLSLDDSGLGDGVEPDEPVADAQAADSVVRTIRDAGQVADAFQADISDPAEAKHLITSVEEAFGRIDGLVNNAGIMPSRPLVEMSDEGRIFVIHTLEQEIRPVPG